MVFFLLNKTLKKKFEEKTKSDFLWKKLKEQRKKQKKSFYIAVKPSVPLTIPNGVTQVSKRGMSKAGELFFSCYIIVFLKHLRP